jgi:hypothetical protein
LHANVNSASEVDVARFQVTNGSDVKFLDIGADATNNFVSFDVSGSSSGAYVFRSGGTERMRLDTSGSLMVGSTGTMATSASTRGQVSINGSTDSVFSLGVGGTYTGFVYTASTTMNVGSRTSIPLTFHTADTERARIDSSGNFGIGTTSPIGRCTSSEGFTATGIANPTNTNTNSVQLGHNGTDGVLRTWNTTGLSLEAFNPIKFTTGGSERARIDSSGNLLVGKASINDSPGIVLRSFGEGYFVRSGADVLSINRLSSDGQLVVFYQDTVPEGNISVSGTTVSYNGGHLSRYAQTTTTKDESLVKGTVLSNLDEMNVYTDADGNPVQNEQLNKVKVSDVEGDANVAGVFVNWGHDEAHNVDEINMAMTGDMIIRIAQGVTVQRGDLLMSAGDGTAKPQGDDIVRSKTVAKVTSTHVTCTYADGSYCVPCVLMAC